MKRFWVFVKTHLLIITIVFIALLLRIIWLDRFPISLTGDELVYIFSAKLFILESSYLHGWNPLQAFVFRYPPGVFPQAELPYLIALLTVHATSLSILRVPYVLMSVGIVIVSYFLGKELFEEKAARWIALVAAVNPWLIVLGRTAYEMTPATLFYLLGIYCLFKARKFGMFTLSFICFLLGFYSYIGTKLIFLPLILVTCMYIYLKNRKTTTKKPYVLFTCLAFVVVCLSVLALRSQSGSRLGEIFLPTNPRIAELVNNERKATIPFPFESLAINKVTVYAHFILDKSIASLSPEVLFSHGDSFYGLSTFGLFYLIDVILFAIGFVSIFFKEKKVGWFVLTSGLIGIIPQVLHKNMSMFTPHLTLLFPWMIMVIGYGLFQIHTLFAKNLFWSMFLVVVYFLFVGQFCMVYFFQHPLTPQSDLSSRLIDSYIFRVSNTGQQITLYSNSREDLFKKYLIYENQLNQTSKDQVVTSLEQKDYRIGNIRFVSCDTKVVTDGVPGIIITQSECGQVQSSEAFVKVSLLLDGGEVYRIYHDSLCRPFTLGYYPERSTLKEFSVEKLSNQNFCQMFISK
jgi:4-amino-4-deoxy-L-arabinose transferase-like glycosyltransferase